MRLPTTIAHGEGSQVLPLAVGVGFRFRASGPFTLHAFQDGKKALFLGPLSTVSRQYLGRLPEDVDSLYVNCAADVQWSVEWWPNGASRECLDPTPLAIPVGMRRPLTDRDITRALIRQELSRHLEQQGAGSFEEEDDFEDDDPEAMVSPYEMVDMVDDGIPSDPELGETSGRDGGVSEDRREDRSSGVSGDEGGKD